MKCNQAYQTDSYQAKCVLYIHERIPAKITVLEKKIGNATFCQEIVKNPNSF